MSVHVLPTLYQSIIHKSRYARYLPHEKRRENWSETIERLENFLKGKVPTEFHEDLGELSAAISRLEIMPSMRLMMTAGDACDRDNIAAYNCSYLAINTPRAFSEALYVLMNGTGVGFSCESSEVHRLPSVPENFVEGAGIIVGDSKLGWAIGLEQLVTGLYDGKVCPVDYSLVRPAGARLRTFGGRASGPAPLVKLFEFVVKTFKEAAGRKLTCIEVHDIMCMIGEIVVVGGVRRSALISLSDLNDPTMRTCKSGEWWASSSWRSLANNSAVYTDRPSVETFLQEWLSLIQSKSGERGIFSRAASQKQAARWGRRKADLQYGTNPCSEIILQDKSFCNLSEVVVRAEDTTATLLHKVKLATILGTIQSTLVDFKYLSDEWKRNAEHERLLGVSLTGIMDNPLLNCPSSELPALLESMRECARETNKLWAARLNIAESVAITCVKPSGTVSQLVDSASGIHARHNPFYTRRIRMDKKDKIYDYLKLKGISCEDEAFRPATTAVFSFPMKAPQGAVCRQDTTAIQQLELWLLYQRHWCEHKPSVTISVKEDEWPEVGAWVWKHFDEISGVSFLPFSEHVYIQAPYEDLTEEKYNELSSKPDPTIDWSDFVEDDDNTEGAQQLACTAGGCEI